MKNGVITVSLHEARRWYKLGGKLKVLALQAWREADLIPTMNKEWGLPSTPKECLGEYLKLHSTEYIESHAHLIIYSSEGVPSNSSGKNMLPLGMGKAMLALCQLLICREVYRNGWKPDWEDDFEFQGKHIIYNFGGNIRTGLDNIHDHILSFQSASVRDLFLQNFEELIEEAKELL